MPGLWQLSPIHWLLFWSAPLRRKVAALRSIVPDRRTTTATATASRPAAPRWAARETGPTTPTGGYPFITTTSVSRLLSARPLRLDSKLGHRRGHLNALSGLIYLQVKISR
jgi:hypothetical protein